MLPPNTQTARMKDFMSHLLNLQKLNFGGGSAGDSEEAVAKLRKKIPLPILEHYDRLVARGKQGVAAVRHQVCEGCHMRVPLGSILTLMRDDDIQMCDTCGRYLYLPDDAKAELISHSDSAKAAPIPPRATRPATGRPRRRTPRVAAPVA